MKLIELTNDDLCVALRVHLNAHLQRSGIDPTRQSVMDLLVTGYKSFVLQYGLIPATENGQVEIAVVKDEYGVPEVLMPGDVIFIPDPSRKAN